MKLIFSMLFWGSPLIACIKVTDGTQSLMSVAQGEASTDLPACEGIKLAAVIDGDHAQCDSLSGPTSEEAEMRCRNSYDTDPYGIRIWKYNLPKDVKPVISTITWRETSDSHNERDFGNPQDKVLASSESQCVILTVKGKEVTAGPVMKIPWEEFEHLIGPYLINQVRISESRVLAVVYFRNSETRKYSATGVAVKTLKDDGTVAVGKMVMVATDMGLNTGRPDVEVLSPGTVVLCYNGNPDDKKASCKVLSVMQDSILVGQTLTVPLKAEHDKESGCCFVTKVVRMNSREALFCWEQHPWTCWLLKVSGPMLSTLEIVHELSIPLPSNYQARGQAVQLWTNRAVLCWVNSATRKPGCFEVICEDSKCSVSNPTYSILPLYDTDITDKVGAATLMPGKVAVCAADLEGNWGRHDPTCEVYAVPEQLAS